MIDRLDIRQEAGLLLPGERDRMNTIVEELESIWNMEEIKARQISIERIIRREIEIQLIFRLWLTRGT